MIKKIVAFLFISISIVTAAEQSHTPISPNKWQEVLVSVYDLDESAKFYKEIAGYSQVWRGKENAEYLSHLGLDKGASAESMLLKSGNEEFGYVRLIKFSNVDQQVPTRPGARVWDTGCYTSIMVRAKNMQSIYDDAIKLNWWTETPITSLKFGTSDLRIVVFKGPQGQQVEAYERLSPPLPETFPEFERLSVPFNIMQSVKDRDATERFFREIIGYDTFFSGPPVTSAKEAQKQHKQTLQRIEDLKPTLEEAAAKLADAKRGREELGEGEEGETRAQKLAKLSEMNKKKAAIEKELETLKENDPAALADLEKELKLVTEAANRWTDNIFECKTYLVKKRGMDKKEAMKIIGITANFDCKCRM